MESINDRIKDLRFQYDAEHISQEDLANALGIPNSTISDYEKPGTYIPHEVILRYCEYFNVSADFLLGRTDIRNLPNAEIHELHLTDKAMEKLKSLPKEARILSDIIEHDAFNDLMIDAAIYTEGFIDEEIQQLNGTVDLAIKQFKEEPPSSEKDYQLTRLSQLHIDQDVYFSHRMQERFKNMLHDIRNKHIGNADTSDMATDEIQKRNEAIFNAAKQAQEKHGKIAGLLAAVKTSIMYSLKIKPNANNSKLADETIKNLTVDEKSLENLLNQSELVEADARKRRKYASKIREEGMDKKKS